LALPIGLTLGFVLLIALVVGRIMIKKQEKSSFQIPEAEIELNILLGEGNFGQVYKGLWRGTTTVAVKILKNTVNELEEFKKEAKLYAQLPPHPNIVQFLGITLPSKSGQSESESSSARIIMEFLPAGNLKSWLQNLRNDPMQESMEIQLSKGIAAGMDHLHSNHIIHRDLAARNIFVHTRMTEGTSGIFDIVPKIGDFGMAGSSNQTSGSIPVRWTAPEALVSGKYTFASDVWSFGVVLFELMTGCLEIPFDSLTNSQVQSFVLSGGHLEPPVTDGSQLLKAMMLSCFNQIPSFRPTFRAIHEELDAASSSN